MAWHWCPPTGQNEKLIAAANPVNVNYNALRSSLLPGLLQILSENRHYDYPQRLFDIGVVFGAGAREELHLAAASCQARADFTEAKSYLEALLRSMGYKPSFKAVSGMPFLDGRAAAVYVKKKKVGVMGEASPKVLENFGLGLPVAAFELGLEKLIS